MEKMMRFPEWKDKAVTLSYDDGATADVRLIGIMQKYGLKGTFNLCSSLLASRTPVEVYLEAGMEIAMHGENHMWVKGGTGADIIREFYQDKLALEKASGQIMRGGAYAYGCLNEETLAVLKLLGISYFRGTKEVKSFDLPGDWLDWPITCRHRDENLFALVDSFLAERAATVYSQKPRLFYLMGHSWEFAQDDSWEIIEKFGEKVAGRTDIWHATNSEIYDYAHAYEGLIFSAAGDMVLNPSPLDVYLWINGKNVLAKANTTTLIG